MQRDVKWRLTKNNRGLIRLKIASGIVIFALILTVFIAGCTSTQNQSNPNGTLTNSIGISAKAIPSPQQFDGSPLTPSPGNKYVLYNVTLTNTNAQDRQVSPLFFALHDASNNVYNIQELIQSRYLSQAFPSGYTMTQPGDKVSGRIVFEVPQNVKLVTMTYDDRSVMGSDNTYSHVVINL